MSEVATLITDLALILIFAGITTLICKKIKQPVIIGYILAGFLLGPIVDILPSVADPEAIEVLAEIGVIFLMFGLGLEFSLNKMADVGISGIMAATVQIVGMVALGFGVGQLLGWGTTNSLFLGGMLSMSSTIITLKAIEDNGMRDQKFAGLSIGTLIIEDIAAIFLMLILSTVSVSRGDNADLVMTIGKLLFYLAIWLVLGLYLIPSFMKWLKNLFNDEILLIVSLGICFGMVLLANTIGFSSALGAFMAGSLLAGTTLAERIEHLITPCKDLFVAVFFVSVGFLVVPATLVEYIVPIIILTVVTIIGKTLLLSLSYMITGEDVFTAVHGGTCQTQVGEFSFVIATMGLTLGVTGDFLYPVIVAVSLITTFTTPFLLNLAKPITVVLEKIIPNKLLFKMEARQNHRNESKSVEGGVDLWIAYLKPYFSRLFLYLLVNVSLLFLGSRLLLPFLEKYVPVFTAQIFLCVVLYLAILPLMPILFTDKNENYVALWIANRANRIPLVFLFGVRVALLTAMIFLVPVLVFDFVPIWLIFIALPVAFFASRSHRLKGMYLGIAAKFLSNMNERQFLENQEENIISWLDESFHVADFICGTATNVTGKSLRDLHWGNTLKVNAIKIVRGKKHYNIPNGEFVLQKGDRLYLIGTEQALNNFRTIHVNNGDFQKGALGGNVTMRYFVKHQDKVAAKDQIFYYASKISDGSAFNNKSIRDSKIREDWHCYLLGLLRENYPIDHSTSMVLKEGDILWLLGSRSTATALLESDEVQANFNRLPKELKADLNQTEVEA